MKKPSKLKMARLYQGRKTPFWEKITGRRHHRLSASVTGEGDWEVEVPQIRMSRAFAVMLVLHVIAVGGLFAYRIWGRDEEPKAGAENARASVAAAAADKPVPITPPSAGSPASASDVPSAGEVKTYTWRAGDSIQLIAARFGVSTSALREANPDKTLVPGAELILPRAGRVFANSDAKEPAAAPAPLFDPKANLAAAAAPEPPAPRAMEVPEDSSHSEVPETVPAPSREPGVIAKQVTARVTTREPAGKAADTKKGHEKSAPAPKAALASDSSSSAQSKQPARTAGQRVHVVSKGDTVYNLARKYGFSPEEIAKANGLGGEFRITMGQQLKIPVKR
jgi:LysM repeat protein